MKFYIFVLLLFTGMFIIGQITVPIPNINKVKAELVKLSEHPDLKNASIGFFAIDMEDNTVIAEYNADMSLVPASVMKVFTTAAALEILGSNFKFKTSIHYTGEIDTLTGELNGNVFILGGGDPCLGSTVFKKNYYEPFFMETWKDSIKSLGIRKINGYLVADASFYKDNNIPSTWIWGDIANYYGAVPSALSIYENTYKLKFNSGANQGDSTYITAIEPDHVELNIDNHVISSNSSGDNAYIYGCPNDNFRYIEGTIPKNRTEFIVKGSIPDPPLLVAGDFFKVLSEDSITVTNGIIEINNSDFYDTLPRTMICTTFSPSLSSIIYWTNLRSHNLFAEHIMYYIGYVKYNTAGNISGTNAITDFWKEKGIDTDGLYVNDGSGLSRYNGVTARQLTNIMKYMNNGKNKEVFKKSLPEAGVSGTLSGICKGTVAENRIFAKSGTMTRVKSYTGYATTLQDRNIAFAVIVNNFNCSPGEINKKLEKILVSIVEYSK